MTQGASTSGRSPEPARKRITVRDLTGPQRYLCLTVGGGGLVAGGIAVFESTNQAGTVALLGLGAVSALLALVGKVPLRWVIGGNEFDMSEEAAEETADVLADVLTPAQTAALAARLLETAAASGSSVTRAVQDVSEFERQVLRALHRVVQARPEWQYRSVEGWEADAGADAMVRDSRTGRTVPLIFKVLRRSDAISRVVADVRRMLDRDDVSDVVLVLASDPTDIRRSLHMFGSAHVHVASFNAADFEARLARAIEAAFARQDEPRAKVAER